jgi:hypothetical protein
LRRAIVPIAVSVIGLLVAASPAVAVDIDGMACPSVGQCTLDDSIGQEITFSPGTVGTPIMVDDTALGPVVCPSVSECTAVDRSGREVTFNPGSPGTPTPTTLASAGSPTGIACPSVSQCTAVDQNGQAFTFNPASPGAPSPTTIDSGAGLSGVACPSVSQCTAIAYNDQEITFNPGSPGSPTSAGVGEDSLVSLDAFACPSVGQCTAVDDLGREVTFNPSAPGNPTPTTIDRSITLGHNDLAGLACPAVSQCTTVDATGREVTFNPGAPGNPTGKTIDNTSLLGVACPSVTECIAFDNLGRTGTFNPRSGGPTITRNAGKPALSHGSLSGVANGKLRLAFTVTAAKDAPAVTTIRVSLPNGLAISNKPNTLTRDISVTGTAGKKLKFQVKARGGKLTVTLRTEASGVKITIRSPSIAATKKLEEAVKTGKVKTVRMLVAVTDAKHSTTRLPLTLKPS